MSDSKESTAATAAVEAETHAAWETHLQAEREAIAKRRKTAFAKTPEANDAPQAGLALSGGGVRSATFCLGLIRGLAQNGVLRRFDYVSTVSGGGFIGAALGRLIGSIGIDKAEEQLTASDSLVVAWLRRNGRYLTPSGARDLGIAAATLLRNGASTHFEVGVLSLLFGLVAIGPHVIQTALPLFDAGAWQDWWSCWWPIALCAWLLFAPGTFVAFWPLREAGSALGRKVSECVPRAEFAYLFLVAAVGLLLMLMPSPPTSPDSAAPAALIGAPSAHAFGALVFAGILGRLSGLSLRLFAQKDADSYNTFAEQRNRMTRSLRRVNLVTTALFLLGLLDVLTWQCTQLLSHVSSSWIVGGVGLGGVVAVLLRSLSDPLQKVNASADRTSTHWLPLFINVAGIAIGIVVLAAWVVLLQWLVFSPTPLEALTLLPPWMRASAILAAVAIWYAATVRHRETVNASSLHSFYRARLTRAYVSLGNTGRFEDICAGSGSNAALDAIASVTSVVPNDDVTLDKYRPEERGGPLHLICTCLNQTVDDHGELYNADRKGSALIASARGFEIGERVVSAADAGTRPGTLGRWIATSGAAAAPGAGSFTTPGWAMLLFLAGGRLGYWLDADSIRRDSVAVMHDSAVARVLSRLSNWLRETKPGLLGCEALASFAGPTRRWWYLSDGGHFENTGVYALLRREVEFIVLADCGADPDFEFADLENLVRKARIDFDAEIEMYTRDEAAGLVCPTDAEVSILSPQDMANNASVRGVLMARICYHRSDPQRRKFGTLLIVKPNLHEALDNDLLAYARRNPTFPQQATSDQFFDEAQWESYHRLGEDFGRSLTPAWLRQLPGFEQSAACPTQVTPLRPNRDSEADKTAADSKPFWRRTAAGAALSTTLGIGAIGTLLVPTWNFIDGMNKERSENAAQIAARKEAANNRLAEIELCVRDMLAPPHQPEAALQKICGKQGSSTVAQKLNEIYQTTTDFPQDPQLRFSAALIGEVQATCNVDAGICPDTVQASLCNAVCRNPIAEQAIDSYWDYAPAKDQAWQQNPLVLRLAEWMPALTGGALHRTSRSSTAGPAPPMPTQAAPPPAPPPQTETAGAQGGPTDALPVPPTPQESAPTPQPSAPPVPPVQQAPHPVATPSDLAKCKADGTPITIYVQIYDEVMRARVEELRTIYATDSVRFAGIENVTSTSAARDAKQPARWRDPTLLVHRPADTDCANAVAEYLKGPLGSLYPDVNVRVRGLPPSFHSTLHALELWLPPAEKAAAK
jgi:hypothetical protein